MFCLAFSQHVQNFWPLHPEESKIVGPLVCHVPKLIGPLIRRREFIRIYDKGDSIFQGVAENFGRLAKGGRRILNALQMGGEELLTHGKGGQTILDASHRGGGEKFKT